MLRKKIMIKYKEKKKSVIKKGKASKFGMEEKGNGVKKKVNEE